MRLCFCACAQNLSSILNSTVCVCRTTGRFTAPPFFTSYLHLRHKRHDYDLTFLVAISGQMSLTSNLSCTRPRLSRDVDHNNEISSRIVRGWNSNVHCLCLNPPVQIVVLRRTSHTILLPGHPSHPVLNPCMLPKSNNQAPGTITSPPLPHPCPYPMQNLRRKDIPELELPKKINSDPERSKPIFSSWSKLSSFRVLPWVLRLKEKCDFFY